MTRLRRRKRGEKPRIVGSIAMHDTGREAHIYCQHRPRSPKHEVLLTEQLLNFDLPIMDWIRGIETDTKYKPDAELGRLKVEYDTGTESRKQVLKQVRQYQDCKSIVLWVFNELNRFNWLQGVATTNTLMMLAGASELYDIQGNALGVDELSKLT